MRTLQFDAVLERDYRVMRNRRHARTNILACLTIVFVFDSFLLTDVDLIRDSIGLSAFLRLAIATPLFLVYPLAHYLIVRRNPASQIPGRLTIVLAVMAFSCVMFLQTATASTRAAEYFTGGLGVMVAFNVIRSGSLSDHLIGTVAMCAIFTLAIEHADVVEPATKPDAILSMYACSAMLLVGAYRNESIQRVGFRAETDEQRRSEHLVALVHEIRGTLAGVLLNAQALDCPGQLQQTQADSIKRIRTGGERISEMLRDVLDLEQLTAGVAVAHLAKCNLVDIIDDALRVVETEAAAYGVAIIRHPADRDIPFITDGPKLRHVVVNFLRNSIRFTPAGGTVEIVLSAVAGTHVIIVADNGIGISPAKQADLFKRFAHVGVPLNGERGSGLGLPICCELVRVLGGELKIESSSGVGTRVTVTLPG